MVPYIPSSNPTHAFADITLYALPTHSCAAQCTPAILSLVVWQHTMAVTVCRVFLAALEMHVLGVSALPFMLTA